MTSRAPLSRAAFLPCVLLWALAGCPGKEESNDAAVPLPFPGQEIRIAVPAGRGFSAVWEGPLREWSAQTGATAQLVELPADADRDAAAIFSGESSPALAIFPLQQAGALVGSRSVAPIPEALRAGSDGGLNCGDLFAGLREKLGSKTGDMLLPIASPVLVCYYRDDLLRAARFSPPQTWDDYQRLLEKLGDWAPGLSAVEPWGDDFRATMFLARAVPFAQHPGHYSLFFDIETGRPLIDGPGFVRALQISRAAVEQMPADVLTYGPADCRAAILGGRAALAIAFESPPSQGGDAGPAEGKANTVSRPEAGAIGCIRLPGAREVFNSSRRAWEPVKEKGINQVALVGFSGLAAAVSSKCSPVQIEAAWNALARLGGRDMVAGFPPGVVGLCRESQLSDPAAVVGPELNVAEAAAYTQATAESLRDGRVVVELPVARRQEFRQSLAAALRGALEGTKSAEAALHQAAATWQRLGEEIGPEKLRDQYRVALGLSPLAR